MEKATKLSTIGLGISLGLAWSIGVLIVGVMALMMEQATVEPFKNLFNNKDNLNFSFGFNRLAIVDLGKNSSQPMVNNEKKTTIMFNGEILSLRAPVSPSRLTHRSSSLAVQVTRCSIRTSAPGTCPR